VLGLDVAEAVDTARVRHALPNLEYRAQDLGRLVSSANASTSC
jgi:hypothetical protein